MSSSRYTLCVVGNEVRGGAQKVELAATSIRELQSRLQSAVEFNVSSATVDAVSLFDAEFGEYILVKDIRDLPAKAKVKVSLAPLSGAPSPTRNASASTAAAFFTDVCDEVLLPALEELTGTSAASLSAILSEAYVRNPEDPHNDVVSKLRSTVTSSVQRAHDQEVHKFQQAASPPTDRRSSSTAAAPQPLQPQAIAPQAPAMPSARAQEESSKELFPTASRKSAAPRKSAPPPSQAEEAAPPARKNTPPPSQVAPVAPAPTTTRSTNGTGSDVIVAYCVYTGVASQRAKAIRISRYKPSLTTILAVLKDKFHSDLSLGYIETDGSYSEVLLDEDLEAVIAKQPAGADCITLHCWTQASADAMEVAYCQDITSRATTPSGKSVVSAVSSYVSSARRSRPGTADSSRRKPSAKKSSTNPMDVSGVCYTEEHLKELFDELDVDDNGYLDKEELRKYFFERNDPMGVVDADKQFDKFLQQCGCFDDGKVTFDEFSIVMLKLAQW